MSQQKLSIETDNDQVGPLDRPIPYTRFPDQWAKTKSEHTASLRDLAALIPGIVKKSKDRLPFFKLGLYGDVRTDKGCLRHDANVLAVTGVEGDHDAGTITPEEACDRIAAVGIAALIYTTPSHMKPGKGPRWRVLAPTSSLLPPEERARLVARLNGILGGTLARESFTLSQAFYAGSVAGDPPALTFLTE